MALSQKGKSGQWEIKANKTGVTLLIDWSETYDSDLNASVVSIDRIQGKSTQYYGISYFLDGYISVDGQNLISFVSTEEKNYIWWGKLNTYADMRVQKGGQNVPYESTQISHNADGFKSIEIKIYIKGDAFRNNVGSGWIAELTDNIELTKIETGESEKPDIVPLTVFYINGKIVFPLYSKKVASILYRPANNVDDSSILGSSIIGSMILGEGG